MSLFADCTGNSVADCTGNSVQVKDCGVWVTSGTTAVMISTQLYNGILIALGNCANDFAMTDLSGSAVISGGDVLITDYTTYLVVPAETFEL